MPNPDSISVREMQLADIPQLVNYWTSSTPEHLVGMGVDLNKRVNGNTLAKRLTQQIQLPYDQKLSYALIWVIDGHPAGHTNVNKITFGKEAFMHLHLWQSNSRKKGMGTTLVKQSLSFYFENLQLEQLFCEPYALNPAPNKTLAKVGFEFEKEYITVPGAINFEQAVKRWKLSRSDYEKILKKSQD